MSAAVGGFGVIALGAAAAAIRLWFLANYTIDTALAPFTFRWFRARPWQLLGTLAIVFALAEAARFAGVPVVPQINWVIGWLGFQVAGFAWQDGRLPTGRALTALAAGFWTMAVAAVAALAHVTGLIPDVEAGTSAWWSTKLPFLVANLIVLVPIVRRVAAIEQRALLGGGVEWRTGIGSMLVVAGLLSVSVKAWSSSSVGVLIVGLAGTLCVWRFALVSARGTSAAR